MTVMPLPRAVKKRRLDRGSERGHFPQVDLCTACRYGAQGQQPSVQLSAGVYSRRPPGGGGGGGERRPGGDVLGAKPTPPDQTKAEKRSEGAEPEQAYQARPNAITMENDTELPGPGRDIVNAMENTHAQAEERRDWQEKKKFVRKLKK